MRQFLTDCLEGLLALFFPKLCLACGENLSIENDLLCVDCLHTMPRTHFYLEKENEFTTRFFGRLPILNGAALFYYSKLGHTQRLLHQLKYHDKPELAVRLGRTMGRELKKSPLFESIEVIVPVPMHPKKEWKRGYNQAEKFAEGLAEILELPMVGDALRRLENRESQTRKGRTERFTNANDLYIVGRPKALAGKHVLLVDDVLTTGATLTSCGELILKEPGTRLSMATIAIASKRY